MKYRQLNAEERSALAALRSVGLNQAEIARELGRHRSTVGRELKRNSAPYDGWYRSKRAHQRARARRYRSRRNSQFGREEWARVEELLREQWSPEQVSGHLGRTRELAISHESIYRHVWRDLKAGGTLHAHLRVCAQAVPEALWTPRQPWETGRKEADRRVAARGGTAQPDRRLGDRHRAGREPRGKQRLPPDAGGAQERLRAHREAESADGGGSQPGAAGVAGAASRAGENDHGGQRDGVPLVCADRSSDCGEILLCDTAS